VFTIIKIRKPELAFGFGHDGRMKTHMNDTQIETIEQIEQIETFLSGIQTVDLIVENKADRYEWIQRALIRLHYLQLN